MTSQPASTTVESTRWEWKDPSPQEVVHDVGLSHRVSFDRSSSTYTWFLKERIEDGIDDYGVIVPKYDLVFLDGSKHWSTDGLAVILIEKLLRPGGWLLMDDLGWTYAKYAQGMETHYENELAPMSETEINQPHLRAIFELIVRPHPHYTNLEIQENWWGWAQKTG